MAKELRVHKAVIQREVGLREVESAVAAGGGVILRVDQRKGETVAYFAGDGEAVAAVKKAAAALGESQVKASNASELSKLS